MKDQDQQGAAGVSASDMTGGLCFLLFTSGDPEKITCVQRYVSIYGHYKTHPVLEIETTKTSIKLARKLGRCDSSLQNLKMLLTH